MLKPYLDGSLPEVAAAISKPSLAAALRTKAQCCATVFERQFIGIWKATTDARNQDAVRFRKLSKVHDEFCSENGKPTDAHPSIYSAVQYIISKGAVAADA